MSFIGVYSSSFIVMYAEIAAFQCSYHDLAKCIKEGIQMEE